MESVKQTVSILAWLGLCIFSPTLLYASDFYVDVGGGLSSIRSGSPLYGGSFPGSADLGIAFDLGIFYNFSNAESGTELHFGINNKYSSGQNGSTSAYALFVPYPEFRLQMSKIYLGFGLSPLIYARNSTSPGIDQFNFTSSSLSILGEVGFLWAVTPKFSLGLNAALQQVSTSGVGSGAGTTGPLIYDFTGSMRFYFGFSSPSGGASGSSGRGSGEFNGWRYPFGNELR